MRYDAPYGPFGLYGDPRYYLAVQEEKRQIRREANRLGWTAFLGTVFLTVLSTGGVLYFRMLQPYQPAFASFGGLNPVLYYLISALGYAVGISVPVLFYFAVRRIPLAAGLPFERAGAVKTLACVFLGSAGCMFANFPASMIVSLEQAMGFSGTIPDMPLNDDPAVLALYVLSVVVIPPMVEEMMFRGMILQGLRRFGDGFAVVASAALFGLYHGNLAQTVFAFLCGLVLGFVVIRTNSLLPAILVHAVNNASAVAIQMVERYRGEAEAVAVGDKRAVVLLALGLLSLLYLLFRDKRFFSFGGPASPLRFSQKLGAMFSNPGVIMVTIYAVVTSVYVLAGT
ncbi:CPBP family intramembrane metalloprotease [Caproiciproducens sp. NJN-50]|uniref:CPBP family intramembrane glutamic endopeptidase n=1 Tax=Acutalibacteraceae TaxID=3082771 RepID=UPI000FFE2FA7|nr:MULTISPECIES: type II CAAX endopeptidase family protein [Acutalibacteraceae]QAT48462.1 CPBP family intramembrane metalloprotease [Caproiciproducens sp. NJN-50]